MAYWLAWEEPRAVGDLVHVEKFFARNLGGLIRARTCAGPAREGNSRTPSMYADEKSDEVVVPRKRPNKGRQKADSRPWYVATRLNVSANGLNPFATDVRPEGGARCVSSARRDLYGGRLATAVPTVTSVTGLSRRLSQSAHHTCVVQNGASFTATGCVASSRNLKIDVVS